MLTILPRSQHQYTLNAPSVEMSEVSGVTSQQIVGPAMNRSQQDRLVLQVEPDSLRQLPGFAWLLMRSKCGGLANTAPIIGKSAVSLVAAGDTIYCSRRITRGATVGRREMNPA